MAMGLHLGAPLIPLGLELGVTGDISVPSVTLVASMYAIAVGASSKWLPFFVLTLLASGFYMFCFGFAVAGTRPFWNSALLSGVGILLVFITHGVERYLRHVQDRTPFFTWHYGRGGG